MDRRFLHAPHSRSRLSVTRKMLLTTASYHQIMPSFLDFLFSFGATHYAKDFFFAGFRQDTRLRASEKGIAVPNLGRSGRSLRLCYSLRSVESSHYQEHWSWSIRGTATHHEFDLESGRTSWLILKGAGGVSMRERIITETSSRNGKMLNKYDSRDQAFSSTMSTHLLLCNWSVENWRWYINYMEEQVQGITRKTLSVKPQLQYVSSILVPSKKTSASKRFQVAPAIPAQGPPGLPRPPQLDESDHGKDFSFEDLQSIEAIEERANEALLVMTLNSSVLSALAHHYTSVMESASCPYELKTKCSIDLKQFVNRISDISAEYQIQRARVETLLRLLADRKALVCIYSCVMTKKLMQNMCTLFWNIET